MMSAAAVIVVRAKRILRFLSENNAYSPQSAVSLTAIPYAETFVFRRLVSRGYIHEYQGRYYGDSDSYQRWRRTTFLRLAIALFILLAAWLAVKFFA